MTETALDAKRKNRWDGLTALFVKAAKRIIVSSRSASFLYEGHEGALRDEAKNGYELCYSFTACDQAVPLRHSSIVALTKEHLAEHKSFSRAYPTKIKFQFLPFNITEGLGCHVAP